ncbi:MAG: VWA domain-containing protein, partial [Acidocella sp. 21-58-7]
MSPQSGLLATNVMHFARLLRRTGLPVGPAETIAAVQALTFIDIGQRSAVQAALRAVMVHRHEHFEMFDQAFALFWRNPDASRFAAALAAMDGMRAPDEERAPPGARRLAEAMAATKDKPPREDTPPQTIDATLTFSARRTRRWQPDAAGRRQDLKATIRNSRRTGGEIVALARASQKIKPPPLVVLCDISGSMARYAQILLHFLHSVANDRDRVSVFLFGTR